MWGEKYKYEVHSEMKDFAVDSGGLAWPEMGAVWQRWVSSIILKFSRNSAKATYMRSQVAAFGCQWLRWPLPSAGRRYNCTDFKFLILLKRSRTLWRLELLCLGSSSQTSRTSRISWTWRTSTFWQISHNSALTAVIKKRNVHSSLSQSYTFLSF